MEAVVQSTVGMVQDMLADEVPYNLHIAGVSLVSCMVLYAYKVPL